MALTGHHERAHAHNDYLHEHPLEDALAQRFYSVEADVWMDGGILMVAHWPWNIQGSLRQLYLDPLQKRVDEKSSVHGDGRPFTLWIDIKDKNPLLPDLLHRVLNEYPMLTEFSDVGRRQAPVTVILTGEAMAKERFVEDWDSRRAVRDSGDYTPDDPPADQKWRAYALNWSSYLSWTGEGDPSDDDKQRMACIMENAHASGRTVRFYAIPAKTAVWKFLLDHGVDFINADDLEGLNAFLESQP